MTLLSAWLLVDKYSGSPRPTAAVPQSCPAAPQPVEQAPRSRQPGDNTVGDRDWGRLLDVTIMTFSNGQSWCNRNSIMNACYQDYPLERVELMLVESSMEPSPEYISLIGQRSGPPADVHGLEPGKRLRFGDIADNGVNGESRSLCGSLRFRYWWFNSSEPFGTARNPKLGALRNMMTERSKGDIIINMDNDDFFHPQYTSTVVRAALVTEDPAPAENSDVRAFVEVKPHAVMVLNPDGTRYLTTLTGNPDWGAHIISMTRAVSRKCEWLHGVAYDEERKLLACIKINKIPRKQIDMEGHDGLGNGLLMIKFKTGMSITHQRFFKGRTEFARMSHADWDAQIEAQSWAYEELHELTRSRTGTPWFGKIMPGHTNRATSTAPETDTHRVISSLLPARVVAEEKPLQWWREWHTKRKDFYDQSGLDSVGCGGFASMPGQMFNYTGDTATSTASSDADCCQFCSAAGTGAMTCTAFEYAPKTKVCTAFLMPKGATGAAALPPGLRYRPETVKRLHTFGLIASYPKIAEG